jgi:hypothetical protein
MYYLEYVVVATVSFFIGRLYERMEAENEMRNNFRRNFGW